MRLAMMVIALVLWLGYLAFLAATTAHPIVLSRPQLLSSNVVLVADLAAGAGHPDPTATVKEVIRFDNPTARPAVDAKVAVKDLNAVGPKEGWEGPGAYILALTRRVDGSMEVTRIPPSPGYAAQAVRIYRATSAARQQLSQIEQQFHPQ
jgi:hypothetical protein